MATQAGILGITLYSNNQGVMAHMVPSTFSSVVWKYKDVQNIISSQSSISIQSRTCIEAIGRSSMECFLLVLPRLSSTSLVSSMMTRLFQVRRKQ